MSRASKAAEEHRRNIIVHLKQTADLASALSSDVSSFRLVDEGNGANDESINSVERALSALQEVQLKLKFVAVRSDAVYAKVKEVYLSMQDATSYIAQAVKKPASSCKDIFVQPFRTISSNVEASVHALVSTISAVMSSEMPNASVLSFQYQLGLTHFHGLEGRPVNYIAAVECFQQAALEGNTEAMLSLAKCYLQGQGVDKSELKGLEWLASAANSNVCPHAQNELAMLIIANIKLSNPLCVKEYCASLLDDSSVARSVRRGQADGAHSSNGRNEYGVEDAIKLLLSAASEGCVEAKCNLGAAYEEAGDLEQAAVWYEQASAEGSMRGTFLLGQLFLRGMLAASKNRTFSLLKKAALGGQNEAYFCLGRCYETGVGTDVSIPLAVDCYRRSAKNGSKLGMYSLGYLLVQNAIEMRRQVQLLRPYALTNRERKGYADNAALVESSAQDEKIALMSAEAEAALQEGIHWLRAASENHVKDAAFQLGRLYEQAIGVPDDIFAALANYKWAAFLGHSKAAYFAGNILYAQATARSPQAFPEAAQYYHQAALGGVVEAMNSYAILLEDGLASEVGIKNLHLAAAWFYQACIEKERMEKAHVNLAYLMANTPLSAFRTISGDIVTLSDAKDFLLDYFESDAYPDTERRDAMLSMIDAINEHSSSALPLVEEVSLSLSNARRTARVAGQDSRTERARSPVGAKAVTVTSEDEEAPVEVSRIPIAGVVHEESAFAAAARHNRVHEEATKLSRGPIQNQGRVAKNVVLESLVSPQDVAPPVHGAQFRSGEMYTTDGPVIPPSFAPRAVQYNQPTFKPDKPPPHTKPTSARRQAATPADATTSAPSVPVLSPQRKGQAPSSSRHAGDLLPPAPPKPVKHASASSAPVSPVAATSNSAAPVRSVSAQRALHAPVPSQEAQVPAVKPRAGKRLSFISGLVHMMARSSGDHGDQDHRPSEEGKTSDGSLAGSRSASADPMRQSLDSQAQTHKPSMWTSLKGATGGTSKSLDLARAPTPDQRMPPASSNAPARSASPAGAPSPKPSMWGAVKSASAHSDASHAQSAAQSTPVLSAPSSARARPASTGSTGGGGAHDFTTPAQGVFASEPREVPSPSKPPKPQARLPQPAPTLPEPSASASHALPPRPSSQQSLQSAGDHAGNAAASGTPSDAPSLTPSTERDQSPSKRHSILTKMMLQARHDKYLRKDPPASGNAAAGTPPDVAAAAATSTGTMDTVSDLDDAAPSGTGAVAMTSAVTGFDEAEEGDEHSVGADHSFEPVSDLSMSSRDIRY